MRLYKYLIFLVVIFGISCSFVYADEIENNSSINKEQSKQVQTQINELKEEANKIVDDINDKVIEIDDKIEKLKDTDEYNEYPTVRLNIDTPIFGIKSIINQRLRITKEVSATDVAKGYSIRSILKNRIIKVPENKLGNITISTKSIDLKDELSVNEYNIVILKLMDYKEKVNSVYNFLEQHTNKIFKEHIAKEKKEKLNELNNRLDSFSTNLLSKENDIITLYLENNEKYDEIKKEYDELSEEEKKLKEQLSYVLIDNDRINQIQKNVLNLESKMIDYTTKIDNLSSEKKDLNLEYIYLKTYNDMIIRYGKIEKIKENANKIVKIPEENKDEKSENENNIKNNIQNNEEIELYHVYSLKYIDSMDNKIKNLQSKMDIYGYKYKKEIDENSEKEKSNIEEKEQEINVEQNKNRLNEIIDIYLSFLNDEYLFYLDNVNGLLKITNGNIKDLAQYTDANVMSDVQYIYIDLPYSLNTYIEKYNKESKIQIKNLISCFENEYEKVLQEHLKIKDIYEKMNVAEVIKNT